MLGAFFSGDTHLSRDKCSLCQCLGALPLLYPAAPPSVFDYCIVKYTAPAVSLEREYVVGFLVVMVWGFFFLRDDGLRCGDNFVFGYILLEDLTGKSSRG